MLDKELLKAIEDRAEKHPLVPREDVLDLLDENDRLHTVILQCAKSHRALRRKIRNKGRVIRKLETKNKNLRLAMKPSDDTDL